MFNRTEMSLPGYIYSADEIALMLAAFGACVASVIYSFKHVKSSSCMGSKCSQEVEGVVIAPVVAPPPGPARLETNV